MARGPQGEDLPDSMLFACTMNAVRSPMAAALMRHLYGRSVFVESCGVHAGSLDPFVVEVMDEIGIDMARHKPKRFQDLEDGSYDLVISLTPQAQHQAVELTRTNATELEFWPTFDPTLVEGTRQMRLDAYRNVRDELLGRIKERFGRRPPPAH
jgi:protein-tyrosine-phosphatase